MCVMPNCTHFDGARDYKERQKTRFSHSGRGNQQGRVLGIRCVCYDCAPEGIEELTIGGHKSGRCADCGYRFTGTEQAFHYRVPEDGKEEHETDA